MAATLLKLSFIPLFLTWLFKPVLIHFKPPTPAVEGKKISLDHIHSESAFRQLVLDWLRKYDPNGYEIVTAYEALPRKFKLSDGAEVTLGEKDRFSNYFSKRTILDMLENIGTLVHEYNHYYTSYMLYSLQSKYPMMMSDEYYYFYIDAARKIPVRLGKSAPTSAISNMIPQQLRKERFSLYVAGNTSTQAHGVYGLLDEMNAYRLDVQTNLAIQQYLKDIEVQDPAVWRLFLSNVQHTVLALYEFRLYIAASMAYMAEHQAAIHQAIINNKAFCEAYHAINNDFERLDNRFHAVRNEVLESFRKKGMEAKVDGDYTFIGDTGFKNYDKYRMRLLEALNQEKIKAMHEHLLQLGAR